MTDIKDCFVSRFHEGQLVEMDYSQLEIIGLAVLSKDPQLKEDLLLGIDIHSVNCAVLYGYKYETVQIQIKKGNHDMIEKRTLTKALSFALQYGAGAKTMARDNDITMSKAQEFIDIYYTRYPNVKIWQDANIERVHHDQQPSPAYTKMGYPAAKSILESHTGRRYCFTEYDAPKFMKDKGTHTSFSPTMIKNYPVQGLCTGDIVPMAFGKVNEYLLTSMYYGFVLPVNTIHDSIIFDIDYENIPGFNELILNLSTVMVSITEDINILWPSLHFDIPLKVECKVGSSWGSMSKFDLAPF